MDLATLKRALRRRLVDVLVPVARVLVRRRIVRKIIRRLLMPFPRLVARLQRFAITASAAPPSTALPAMRQHGLGPEAARLSRQIDWAFARRRGDAR
jgi:hypothetical protein